MNEERATGQDTPETERTILRKIDEPPPKGYANGTEGFWGIGRASRIMKCGPCCASMGLSSEAAQLVYFDGS